MALNFSNLLEAERLPSLLRNFMQIRYISVLVPGCQSVMFMQIFKSELPLKATANVLHSGTQIEKYKKWTNKCLRVKLDKHCKY